MAPVVTTSNTGAYKMDYFLLKCAWWLFVAVLVSGFMLLGGRDLGVAYLLLWSGKTDEQRQLILSSIGPTWEGNQVWFITAGGALFAAWPLVYAVAFSSFYYALFLVLFGLILRPPGIDYRDKLPTSSWRQSWDIALWLSGLLPILLIGVALGNAYLGIPFHFDGSLRSFYTGEFFALLHPFALLVGVVSLSLCTTQAALFLNMKIADITIQKRVQKFARFFGVLGLTAFGVCGFWLSFLPGYKITQMGALNTALIPTHKTVVLENGAWLHNMHQYPLLTSGILVLIVLLTLGSVWISARKPKTALYGYSLSMVGTIAIAAIGLFPFILPSSSHPNHSLTAWDAVSSRTTLQIMFWVVIGFLPIVLAYTGYAYRMMSGSLSRKDLEHSAY